MRIGLLQGHRVTEWVADAIGLPQYVPVFKDNLITVSTPVLTSHQSSNLVDCRALQAPHQIDA